MQRLSEEWHKAVESLMTPLLPHQYKYSSMFVVDDRCVTVKHRMRKDRIAVVTLGCMTNTGDGPTDYPDIKWCVTTAMPIGEQATKVAQSLLHYLLKGVIPELHLETYPGYEDLKKDQKDHL